jgi:RNase P/RNase MRP subunit p29
MPKADAVPVAAEPEKKADMSTPNPIAEEKPASPAPKIEPDPQHHPISPTAAPTPLDQVNLPVSSREKQEFLLSNGERILGRILSETTDALVINHETLGVLTIPRAQIAKRLIEIILINGDRIVGDVIAETPDCLYVRHASLGMLTVPHKQRSTRVVEAILKDGDRILGEVLAETENFTVIRSATLGTVAVQHNQVAMLNRKIEQIQLKALPPSTPAIENKPAV